MIKKLNIGILTLPNAINYGGILQAYAMQEYFRHIGHSPQLIDFRFEKENFRLLGMLSSRNPRRWLRTLCGGILGCGEMGDLVRHWRTVRFSKENLLLTPWSITALADAPTDVDFDILSVGSDQVWNPAVVAVESFLLEGVPWKIPAIAYAASIGMNQIPDSLLLKYKEGFSRFLAIGIRERNGVELAKELGFDARHVCDPTLLVDRSFWREKVRNVSKKRRTLTCYFLDEDIDAFLPILKKFAQENDVDVIILTESRFHMLPRTYKRIVSWWKRIQMLFTGTVHFKYAADPFDFITYISNADWVLTNSFHALMFASVFDKDIKIINPLDKSRKKWTIRMTEFVDAFVDGPVFVNTVAEALSCFDSGISCAYNRERIDVFVRQSREWLDSVLCRKV